MMVYAISLLLHIHDGEHGFSAHKTVNDAGLEIWLGPLCIIIGCLTPISGEIVTTPADLEKCPRCGRRLDGHCMLCPDCKMELGS
jgi:hypothetical protein